MLPYTPAPSRRTHRKRISALRLSSDTTATLPEYSHWQHRHDLGTPSDLPPDYPDSAEEADEDTDDDQHTLVYTPQSSSRLASPRSRRYLSHRRKPSSSPPSTDSFLDSLLERSVHALEMSNALLQTSMAPQPSSSRIDDVDLRPSTSRLRNVRDVWADDLEKITRDVDRLCEDGPDSRRNSGQSSRSEGSISMSLPISSSPPEMLQHRHRRRPSMEYPKANASTSDLPQLRLEPVGRARLVAPAPRAMTQYVASNGDASTISLPSTLGLRSAPSAHCAPISPPLPPPSSTRAYNMLSSIVGQSSSSHSSTSSRRSSFLSRRSTSTSTERGGKSPDAPRNKSLRSRSQTPKPITIPTIEESPSSSSSEEWRAKMTVKSLRKILDEQPVPPPPPVVPLSHRFPITPASPPEASASTATASISRLFSKGTHSSSTRAPSPPRQSVLKTSPSTPSTSGRSTPKRISFAELPEAHQSQTGKFKDKGNKRKSKRKDKKEEHEGGWWGWLATGVSANEARMEDRMQRGWGGPSGRLDDWSV